MSMPAVFSALYEAACKAPTLLVRFVVDLSSSNMPILGH